VGGAVSAAPARPDLSTLAALGGSPGRRRTLAGAHALVITALGALAGLALGVCTGQAAVPVAGLPVLAVPWQHLVLTTFAVPLLASVVAAVTTPSRLPMIARQEP
jgi:putative ABC transport system permease protein